MILQQEHYFLIRVPRGEVSIGPEVREAHIREGITAVRWWSLEEIEATSEEVFPEDLSERLRGLAWE